MMILAQLLIGLSLVFSAARMILRPQSYVGSGVLDASDPRTVRTFGWFFLILGLVGLGLASMTFVEGK